MQCSDKCTAYCQTGLGGLPMALRLTEGLGRTVRTGASDRLRKLRSLGPNSLPDNAPQFIDVRVPAVDHLS